LIGATGPQGATGPTGPQGIQGATGPQGEIGATGAQGIQGPTGPQGIQGLTGPQGEIGATGAQGIQGVTGATGATGPEGPKGASTGKTYWFNTSQTSSVPTYSVLATSPSGAPQQLTTGVAPGSTNNHLVASYITEPLGFMTVPGGSQLFHLHFIKPGSNDNLFTYVELQLANSAGVPYPGSFTTSTEYIDWNAGNPSLVLPEVTLATFTLSTTDRMIARIYINNTDATSHSYTFYTEGSQYYSYVLTSLEVIGNPGATGPTGPIGATGATGPQGEIGATGPQGEIGATGAQGIQGPTGAQGATGPQGFTGSNGDANFKYFTYSQAGTDFKYTSFHLSSYSLANTGLSTNTLWIFPIYVKNEVTIKSFGIFIQTLSAGNSVWGVYDGTTGKPQNLLFSTLTPFNNGITGAQVYTLPTPYTLSTGVYYVGYVSNSSAICRSLSAANNFAVLNSIGVANANANGITSLSRPSTYSGALPANWTGLTSSITGQGALNAIQHVIFEII
jgi:hypothetical protein